VRRKSRAAGLQMTCLEKERRRKRERRRGADTSMEACCLLFK